MGNLFFQLLEGLDEDEKAFLIRELHAYCAEIYWDTRLWKCGGTLQQKNGIQLFNDRTPQ